MKGESSVREKGSLEGELFERGEDGVRKIVKERIDGQVREKREKTRE